MTSLPLKMTSGIWTHLLSTEGNGKDWRIICMQNWHLAYALYAIGKYKAVIYTQVDENGLNGYLHFHFCKFLCI